MKRQITATVLATLLSLTASQAATTTVFFDDFEDESLTAPPAINTSSIGGGDLPDVGTSWTTSGTQASYVDSLADDNGTIHRGMEVGRGATATAAFASSAVDGSIISLDFDVDYTSAGTSFAEIVAYNGANKLFHLLIRRGNSGPKVRLANVTTSGTNDPITGLSFAAENPANGWDEWRYLTITLGASSYSVTVNQQDGTPANGTYVATGIAYYDAGNIPTTINSLVFIDSNTSADRKFGIDNVKVEVPVASALTWLGGGANQWNTSSLVWTNLDAAVLSAYSEGSQVTFDDTSVNLSVTLAANVSPSGTIVNSTNNYTFTGNGILTGSLLKTNSGTLTFSSMVNTFGAGISVLGGTLKGGAATMQGNIINNATVNFDQTGSNTYAGSMSGSGPLIKTGAGTVSMTGANSYSGNTLVQAGRLDLRNTYSGGGSIQVSNGATLGVTDGNTSSTLNVPSLVFAGSNTLIIDDGAAASLNPIIATPNFTNSGTLAITYSAGIIPPGSIVLIDYVAGTSVIGGFTLNPLPAGYSGYLTTNGANSSIDLVITGTPAKVWSGTFGNLWDIDSGGGATTNWNAGTSTYADGQAVSFNDTGINTAPVSVNGGGTVAPAFMVVSNSATPYSFDLGIINTPLLVKDGSGSMTLLGSFASTFTNVDLRAGLLSYSLSGSIITVNDTFTGAGTLRQADSFLGVLTLAGNMSAFHGPIQVTAGTLKLGGNSRLGTTNGTTTVSSGATLDVNGFTAGREVVVASGAGISSAGAIMNNGANQQNALAFVTLAGNTTFGGTGRWDIRAPDTNGLGSLSTGGNAYGLTKVGTGEVHLNDVNIDPALGNITISEGMLAFEQKTSQNLGNPASTLTVAGGATLSFSVDSTVGYVPQWNKVISLQSGALVRKAGAAKAILVGPVNLDPGAAVTFQGVSDELFVSGPVTGGSSEAVTKTGAQTITLAGANTYNGLTTVSAGTLKMGTAHAGGGDFTVTNGATLGALVTSVGTTFTMPNLTLGVTSGGTVTLLFDIGTLGNPTAPVMRVTGTLTTNAGVYNVTVAADLQNLTLTGGTPITLLKYPAGQFTNDVVATLPTGLVGVVTNNQANAAIELTITAVSRALTWVGDVSSNWNINTTTNWLTGTNKAVYRELGLGDNVTFTDTASNYNVTVAQTVMPFAVTVSGTNDYSIGGSFAITGPGTLTKTGNGTLTLASANSYTGGTTISVGRVQIGNANAPGSGTVTLNGGTLSSDSGTARILTNAVAFSATSSLGDTVQNGALTFSGPVDLVSATRVVTINSPVALSGTVAGGMERKTGPGTLTFLGISNTNGVIGNWQIEDGNVVVDGGSMNKTQGGIRVTSRVTNGVSRFQIINGASLTNAANIRVGSAGGNLTATNYLDISAALIANGGLQMGDSCALAQLNLNVGGLVTVNGFTPLAGGFTKVDFNGGTLGAIANNATFMEGLSNVTFNAAGAIIDTAGFDITINQNPTGTGGLTKVGNGTLTLTAPLADYTGATLVSAGTLDAYGSFKGAVSVGALGTITPKAGTIFTSSTLGNLTLGGTTRMEISKLVTPDADQFVSGGSLTLGGTLVVTNLGPSALAVGNSFTLFSGALSGSFSSVVLPTVDPVTGYTITWANTLGSDGKITVASLTPSIVINPPPHLTNMLVGAQLQLSWGAEYLGYTLLKQTNLRSVGLNPGGLWVPIPGTTTVTGTNLPINPADQTVFYRLVYTNAP